jgi:uncharacterized protein involved in response to NO
MNYSFIKLMLYPCGFGVFAEAIEHSLNWRNFAAVILFLILSIINAFEFYNKYLKSNSEQSVKESDTSKAT